MKGQHQEEGIRITLTYRGDLSQLERSPVIRVYTTAQRLPKYKYVEVSLGNDYHGQDVDLVVPSDIDPKTPGTLSESDALWFQAYVQLPSSEGRLLYEKDGSGMVYLAKMIDPEHDALGILYHGAKDSSHTVTATVPLSLQSLMLQSGKEGPPVKGHIKVRVHTRFSPHAFREPSVEDFVPGNMGYLNTLIRASIDKTQGIFDQDRVKAVGFKPFKATYPEMTHVRAPYWVSNAGVLNGPLYWANLARADPWPEQIVADTTESVLQRYDLTPRMFATKLNAALDSMDDYDVLHQAAAIMGEIIIAPSSTVHYIADKRVVPSTQSGRITAKVRIVEDFGKLGQDIVELGGDCEDSGNFNGEMFRSIRDGTMSRPETKALQRLVRKYAAAGNLITVTARNVNDASSHASIASSPDDNEETTDKDVKLAIEHYEEGKRLYTSKKFGDAMHSFKQAKALGHRGAQFYISVISEPGRKPSAGGEYSPGQHLHKDGFGYAPKTIGLQIGEEADVNENPGAHEMLQLIPKRVVYEMAIRASPSETDTIRWSDGSLMKDLPEEDSTLPVLMAEGTGMLYPMVLPDEAYQGTPDRKMRAVERQIRRTDAYTRLVTGRSYKEMASGKSSLMHMEMFGKLGQFMRGKDSNRPAINDPDQRASSFYRMSRAKFFIPEASDALYDDLFGHATSDGEYDVSVMPMSGTSRKAIGAKSGKSGFSVVLRNPELYWLDVVPVLVGPRPPKYKEEFDEQWTLPTDAELTYGTHTTDELNKRPFVGLVRFPKPTKSEFIGIRAVANHFPPVTAMKTMGDEERADLHNLEETVNGILRAGLSKYGKGHARPASAKTSVVSYFIKTSDYKPAGIAQWADAMGKNPNIVYCKASIEKYAHKMSMIRIDNLVAQDDWNGIEESKVHFVKRSRS